MERLGYDRYGAQGGDWGAAISRELGRTRPEHVIGVHLNLLPGLVPARRAGRGRIAPLSPDERERTLASWERSPGVEPRPAGLCRHPVDPAADARVRPDRLAGGPTRLDRREVQGVDRSRDRPEDAVDRDQLLTNVMLYWLTGTAGSSARIYYERAHAGYWGMPPEPSTVPTALAVFPQDNFIPLRHIADRTNNIVQWTEYDRGGHFAAWSSRPVDR